MVGTLRIDAGARGRPAGAAPACCPPASPRSRAASSAATPSWSAAPDGTPVAKGLAAFDAADAKALVGRRTDEIEAVLGYRGRAEMVHRDDLVLL